MRGTRMRVFAAAATALALFVPSQGAGAMTLPAPLALAAVSDDVGIVERVKTVCEKEWDGYEWQSRCRTVGAKNSRSAQIRRLQRRIFYYLRHF